MAQPALVSADELTCASDVDDPEGGSRVTTDGASDVRTDGEATSFRFEYDPGAIRFGHGCVAGLGEEVANAGAEHALVVAGETVGRTAAVMDPIRDGLGERFAGTFAETTPEKRLATAVDGARALDEHDADAIVAVGGGSSLDVAKAIQVVAGRGDDIQVLAREFAKTGTLAVPDDVPATLAIPTTFAGAELSQGGGLSADPEYGLVDEAVGGGLGDPALMPAATFYDPTLFATTPKSVLAGSAMNGFDKGIETVYSKNATAITDATAIRGLRKFRRGLLAFADDHEAEIDAAVEGQLLVKYGTSRPDGHTLSFVHAFGHALTAHGSVQQGVAHGIVAPAALEYLFEQVDGRRELFAEAFDVDDERDPADVVIEEVRAVRDALDLPTRLRDVDGPDRDEFAAVAEYVLDDSFMRNAPAALDPDVDELVEVLDAAW